MVCKKSEYQKQFKTAVFVKNIPNYLDNLTFRRSRKREEFIHTPLIWEDPHSQCSSCSSESSSVLCDKKQSVAVQEGESLKNVVGSPPAENVTVDPEADHAVQMINSPAFSSGTDVHDISGNIEDLQREALAKRGYGGKLQGKGQHEQPIVRNGKAYIIKKKHKQGTQDGTVKKHAQGKGETRPRSQFPRPDRRQHEYRQTKSAVSAVRCHPKAAYSRRPPFVSYGWADQEDSVSVHRTHNVLSGKDVYPSAVKASHLQQRQRRQEKLTQKQLLEQTLLALSGSSKQNPAQWETEYRAQFAVHTSK